MRRVRTALFVAVLAVAGSVSLKPAAVSADLLCSCQLCANANVICRISPTGYSTTCENYYQTNCL